MKTIIVSDGDKLIRVPDPTESPSPGRWPAILGVAGLLIAALVGRFYFGFGWLAAVLLAPVLLVLSVVAFVIAFLLLLFVIGAVPFYIRKHQRDRAARLLLDSVRAGSKATRVILFLRQFNPDRGSRFKVAMSRGDKSSGLELLESEFQRFDLDAWADELENTGTQVLKVADRIDAAGGSVRLDNQAWKETVGELIKRADRIAMLPGLGEGVLWETEQAIALKRLDATTFIMPYGSTPGEVEGPLWERYRVKYGELGIDFPRYDREGMVMRFDQNGTLLRTLPIIGSRKEELRGFIES
jgi:hypothetical protein